VVRDDQPEAREGQAGRPGVSERFIVLMKPGNAGGGTGPQFKTNAIRSEGPGDWVTYQLRRVFRNCRWRCTRKRRQKPAIVSTLCTTRSAVRILRTSRRMGCNDGLVNWRLRSGRRLIDRTPSEECSYRRPLVRLHDVSEPSDTFATLEAAERHFRDTEEGEWTEGAVRRFVQDIMVRDGESGRWCFPYARARLRRLRAFIASSASDYNLFAQAKAVRCPALVFRGGMSKRFPSAAEQPFLEAFVSKPEAVLCPRSGHFPTATEPDIVVTWLKRWACPGFVER